MGFVLSLSLSPQHWFLLLLFMLKGEFWLDISDTDASLICMVLLFKSTLKWCNRRLNNDVEFLFIFNRDKSRIVHGWGDTEHSVSRNARWCHNKTRGQNRNSSGAVPKEDPAKLTCGGVHELQGYDNFFLQILLSLS